MYVGVKIYSFQYLKVLLTYLSNLENRTQVIVIDWVKSTKKNIVSQGSVLGPLLYVFYTAPVADIIRRRGLGFHFYSDDTQLYLAFVQTTPDQQVSLAWIEHCVKEIDTWMLCNTLKPNGKKTELLVLSAQHRPRPEINHLHVSFKVLNDVSPQYPTDMLQHYLPPRTLRPVTKNRLLIPSPNLVEYGKRSFSYTGPKL